MFNQPVDSKVLFFQLFNASTEEELEVIIQKNPSVFANENWSPLGGDKDFFGMIENQQSSPIAALIEKITNSMYAIFQNDCTPHNRPYLFFLG